MRTRLFAVLGLASLGALIHCSSENSESPDASTSDAGTSPISDASFVDDASAVVQSDGSALADSADVEDAPSTDASLIDGAVDGSDSGFDGGTVELDSGTDASPDAATAHGVPVQVATYLNSTCARSNLGQVACWGGNAFGQLGLGDNSERLAPAQMINFGPGRSAKQLISGNTYYACAVLDDDTVHCWGRNDRGQLGIGTNVDSNTPATAINFGAGRSMKAMSLAVDHACALLDDATVKCWGAANTLGTAASVDSYAPSTVVDFGTGRSVKKIAAGKGDCAILDDDTVHCWGTTAGAAIDFGVGRYAVDLASGPDFRFARLDDGTVMSWGSNAWGQRCNGYPASIGWPTHPEPSFVVPNNGLNMLSFVLGYNHGCGMFVGNVVGCWGREDTAGIPTIDVGTPLYPAFPAGRSVVSLGTGGIHTCAILDDASVMCWGSDNDYGEMGIGTKGGFTTHAYPEAPLPLPF